MADMFRLDEQTQMVATMVRQWCQSQLAPHIPALEHGTEQPFEIMKKMAKGTLRTTGRPRSRQKG